MERRGEKSKYGVVQDRVLECEFCISGKQTLRWHWMPEDVALLMGNDSDCLIFVKDLEH